jgi:hypothetical protein
MIAHAIAPSIDRNFYFRFTFCENNNEAQIIRIRVDLILVANAVQIGIAIRPTGCSVLNNDHDGD